MPRPCAVEPHARGYKKRSLNSLSLSSRCHGLAPWSLTLVATKSSLSLNSLPDATALRRGVSRSRLQKAPSLPDATALRSSEKIKTHRNLTQVTENRRLGRGQSIGSRCDKSNAPPLQL